MISLAYKMLVGERGRYIAMIIGVFFASLIITQQSSIFVGLMSRTFGFLADTRLPDIWVVDSKAQHVEDIKPLQDTQLLRVRGIDGVDWAVPLYKGLLRARLSNGAFQQCNVIGLDDASLIGAPPVMLEGNVGDLRRADGVIIDDVGATNKLASPPKIEGGKRDPLKIGDTIELNDHRAVVVGIARVTRTFQSNPVVYTTYSRATTFAPKERKLLSFVLVKARPGVDIQDLKRRITEQTGLATFTNDEFSWYTVQYFLKYTGIPINFGIAVILGLIIGTAIAGQTFYSFTVDNLRYFGTLRAMGASTGQLLRMIIFQAGFVGFIGYGLGVGVASLFGLASKHSELAFRLLWQILALAGVAVVFVCIVSAVLSMWKVLRLEPAIVFKS